MVSIQRASDCSLLPNIFSYDGLYHDKSIHKQYYSFLFFFVKLKQVFFSSVIVRVCGFAQLNDKS
jgi:hypothetical protein